MHPIYNNHMSSSDIEGNICFWDIEIDLPIY